MKVKITANFLCRGKRKEVVVETNDIVENTINQSDTTELSNIIKKWFEDELNRLTVVKVKIKKEQICITATIRPDPDEVVYED